MPRKIGIVDDSVTIRAAFHFTFAGEDLGTETHLFATADEALRFGEKLDLLFVDTKLGSDDGYAVCAKLRGAPAFAATPVVLVFGPWETFDEARGRAAGAVGAIQKPWESDDIIAKTQGFLTATPPPVAAVQPAAAPAAAPVRPAAPAPAPAAPVARPMPPAAPRVPTQIQPPARMAPAPPMSPARPQPAPVQPAPTPARPVPAAMPLHDFAQAAAPAAARAMEKKVAAEVPGLTPEQTQAVIRLVSREVIEQVAWEVVPDLAEAIIREQLQALLKE